jgi:hypothetical protein
VLSRVVRGRLVIHYGAVVHNRRSVRLSNYRGSNVKVVSYGGLKVKHRVRIPKKLSKILAPLSASPGSEKPCINSLDPLATLLEPVCAKAAACIPAF